MRQSVPAVPILPGKGEARVAHVENFINNG